MRTKITIYNSVARTQSGERLTRSDVPPSIRDARAAPVFLDICGRVYRLRPVEYYNTARQSICTE